MTSGRLDAHVSLVSQAARGRGPWLERVQRWRARIAETSTQASVEVHAVKRSASDAAALIGAGVPPPIAARHEASLSGAIGDAAAVVFVAKRLGLAETRPLADALKRFYAALSQQLDLVEPSRRSELSERSLGALRCLLEENANKQSLVPTILTVAALMDACSRRAAELGWTDAGQVSVGEMAAASVAELIERFEAAPGLGAALAAHPNLSEQADLVRTPAGFLEQGSAWSKVTRLLSAASPREGFSLGVASHLAELLGEAIARGDPDPLASAVTRSLASTAPLREPLLATLAGRDTPLARALIRVIEASPAGPEGLFRAVESLASSPNPNLAAWVLPLAGSPGATIALERLRLTNPERPPGPDLAASLVELSGVSPEALGVTREPWRLFVALAAGPEGDAPLLRALAEEVVSPSDGRTLPDLVAFAERYRRAKDAIAGHPELGSKREQMIAPIAHLAVEDPEPLLQALARVKATLPLVDVASLIGRDGDGRPGVEALVDPKSPHRVDPLPLWYALLDAARADAPADRAGQTETARSAIQLAHRVGQISVNPERQMTRVLADWRLSLAHPEKLLRSEVVPARTLLAAGDFRLSKFRAAHPAIPPELALTAAVHLSASQVAWVEQRLERVGKSRAGARACRDFVYGLVEANRTDLIDACARSTSSARAMTSAIDDVAVAFRRNEVAHASLDLIAQGLSAGRDPIRDRGEGSKAGTLEGVDLLELTQGRVTERGAEHIARVARQLNLYLALYKSGGSNADGFDQAYLRPKLLSAIRAEAEGTYPELKYKGAANQALLAMMALWAQEYFKRTSVTFAEQPAQPAAELSPLLGSLERIGLAMTESIELGAGPDGPFLWDAPSLRSASALRDELIAEFHELDKNDEDRPNTARSLGIVSDVIALLELQQGVASRPGDPTVAMLGLRPLLERALPALTRIGGPAFADAARSILAATEGLGASPESGKYAIDDDSFLAFLEAPLSGCYSMAWLANGRHWAMASHLLDANVRQLRVMDGDQQRYRSLLKAFHGSFDGYEGPVLWLDFPQPDGGGTDEDLRLLYRHALNKAAALGYPLMIGEDNFAYPELGHTPDYEARNCLGAVAQSMGLSVVEHAQATMRVHPGAIGVVHSDTLFADGAGRVERDRKDAPYLERTVNVRSIVLPPGGSNA